jgi:B12-binding domain/radical SAM domain protein
MGYDVLLLHPPTIYDMRKRWVLPGPIYLTVPSTIQFVIPPVGLMSIAAHLADNGLNVKVFNIAQMTATSNFDVEEYIKRAEASIFGIDLHWSVHSNGAIEVARLCKKYHPNSTVVLGGLTASRFHDEILSSFNFIDIIVRGESEEALLSLAKNRSNLSEIPNLTYRKNKKSICINNSSKPFSNIDDLDFTRLDLIEPKLTIFTPYGSSTAWWNVPVCRGCIYNCTTCGGSQYSYSRFFNRDQPAFRSPQKIVEDLKKLREQGVKHVFLFQDPRIGGRNYCADLLASLRREKVDLERLSMELFSPAEKEYIEELSRLGPSLALTISPESGTDTIRKSYGRDYTNEELLQTVELCRRYSIECQVFFMLALSEETPETVTDKMWSLSEKIQQIDRKVETTTGEYRYKPLLTSIINPMVLLDPGSLAFDFPEKYGYKLKFRNFHDYYTAMTKSSWENWISYETNSMDTANIVEMTLKSLEKAIRIQEKFGSHYGGLQPFVEELFEIDVNKFITQELVKARNISESSENTRLKVLKYVFKDYFVHGAPVLQDSAQLEPEYNYYNQELQRILANTTSMVDGCSIY